MLNRDEDHLPDRGGWEEWDVEERDRFIGRNVYRLREDKGLTQAVLADRVSEHGPLKMHQQTLAKIENGTRPMRLAEALLLAYELEVEVSMFTAYPFDTYNRVALEADIREMWTKQAEALEAVEAYNAARARVAERVDDDGLPDYQRERVAHEVSVGPAEVSFLSEGGGRGEG